MIKKKGLLQISYCDRKWNQQRQERQIRLALKAELLYHTPEEKRQMQSL